MIKIPELIFLDTNVYLIGAVELQSPEGLILQWLGWEAPNDNPVGVIISEELIDQIAVTVQGVIKKMSYMELDGITMNKQL
jgi:hypothetical protein